MNKDDVINLMKSSTSKKSWDDNIIKVKQSFNGELPDYWDADIVPLEPTGLYEKKTLIKLKFFDEDEKK